MSESIEIARRVAAIRALEYLDAARVIGLGTGSTVEVFLKLAYDKLVGKTLVASSIDTAIIAKSIGLTLADPVVVDRVDLYVDSADEVDPLGRMVKGGGGAMTMEKILAFAADMRVFIVDELKVVPKVPHKKPIPVEVVPQAISIVKQKLEREGFECHIRVSQGKRSPVITDLGGAVLDVFPPKDWGIENVAQFLDSLPGVIEHGVFVGLVDVLLIGRKDGEVEVVTYKGTCIKPQSLRTRQP
ncbi:MAG: ribose 5-phosphate isomerase A [Sulfolobales archaeon]